MCQLVVSLTMKIYTKKGDKGKTRLLEEQGLTNSTQKLRLYGNIDELNSFIGHIHDQDIDKNHKEFLVFVQRQLLNLGSIITFDGTKKSIKLPQVSTEDIQKVEREIDLLEDRLPQLTQFILPSGHNVSSLCHIARTVCRRQKDELSFCLTKEKNMKMQLNF